jgi:hypothetical protein
MDDELALEPPAYLDATGQLILRTLTRRLHQGDGFSEADLFGLHLIAYLCQRRYGDHDDEALQRLLDQYFPKMKRHAP